MTKTFFQKTIDKSIIMWYNKYRKRERDKKTQKKFEKFQKTS